jgi:tRNA uracil 4-sulfurtransferase
LETVTSINPEHIIIDIRSYEEQEEQPLVLNDVEIKLIPFYKLATKFADLDQSKQYLLYCDRGVMSKLQALYLIDQGFSNVNVFKIQNRQ